MFTYNRASVSKFFNSLLFKDFHTNTDIEQLTTRLNAYLKQRSLYQIANTYRFRTPFNVRFATFHTIVNYDIVAVVSKQVSIGTYFYFNKFSVFSNYAYWIVMLVNF